MPRQYRPQNAVFPFLAPALLALGWSTASFAGGANLRPAWLDDYQLYSGLTNADNPNYSYLATRNARVLDDRLVDQIDSLMDRQQAQEWKQQYEDLNRDYDMRKRAGLISPTAFQSHSGAVSDFSNKVLDEIEKRKLAKTGDAAVRVVEKHEAIKTVLAPGAVAAGFYIGRPVSFRLTDESRFSFRTSVRDRMGQLELHSSLVYGSFEYHPQAPDSYSLINPTGVDFGKAMDFNYMADFGAERYQFKLVRALPYFDVNSSVLYGSSSNVVAGSLTKQLTDHVACVVDSIRYLTPYDDAHAMEERVRLRYDIHF
jgi:hypothetical protein